MQNPSHSKRDNKLFFHKKTLHRKYQYFTFLHTL